MSSLSSALGGGPGGAARPLHACTASELEHLSAKQEMRPERIRAAAASSWRDRFGGGGGGDCGDVSGSLRAGQGSPPAGQALLSTLGILPRGPLCTASLPSTSLFPVPPSLFPRVAVQSRLAFLWPLVCTLQLLRRGRENRRKETRQKCGKLLKEHHLRHTHVGTPAHAHTHASSPILSPGVFYSGVRSSGLEPVAQSPG